MIEEIEEVKEPETSPARRRMVLQHRLQIEEEHARNTWDSCCLTLDRRAVQYFTQIGIIVAVMAFCVSQLASEIGGEDARSAYLGLLTLLLGLVVPNPTFKDNDRR